MSRHFVRLLIVSAALLAALAARAGQTLVLGDDASSVDAWPALEVLADPGRALGLEDVLRRREAFAAPQGPRNNFGPRSEALWFRLPLEVRGAQRRWVLEVDYPGLNRIDVWLLAEGRVVQRAVMGNTVEAAQRPIRSRSHAMPLEWAGGSRHELVLRVETASAMVVPVRLHESAEFVHHESSRLLLQGLMCGLALMLLVTSLASAVSLRDRVFVYYAMLLLGVTMFFVSYSGVGHAFLWSVQTGLLAKISPWGALLGVAGASLFVIEALEMRRVAPRLTQVLHVVAAAALSTIGLSLADLLGYRATQVAATVLGPVPVLLALHESVRQARAGSRIARYLVLGWTAYTVGALSMAALLRGWVPVDFWTQHLFQFSSVVEMFAWMQVLALRVERIRREAERSLSEKRTLHSMAHTDSLTGLPNRRGLALALDAALPQAAPERPLALFMLDLDGFKAINDRLGHDAGDHLLAQVGRRLRGLVRASDTVARLGGDEFVVMSPGVSDEAGALAIGRKILAAFQQPFVVAGQSCRVGLTIGCALAPLDGREAAVLLRHADAALYAGKQGGRACIRRAGAPAGLAGS